ncbi:DUF1566 domain-containing protein, partial [candidate division KSB3 bacterium]|nr:DUF1566 domain-containing protein [candidate division KSB3 bacterium]MBD3325594.1 DUF1566 domain-containing protein [candidate division KSB3 bacterium]
MLWRLSAIGSLNSQGVFMIKALLSLFEYLRDAWMLVDVDIGTIFTILIAVLPIVSWLVVKFYTHRKQRKLLKDLHPFYTFQEIQRATQYYVETKCQNVATSKHEEPGRGYAFATREKTIPFFLKKAFTPTEDECQFYMVLADSGMGKTTLLINLYLRYIGQFWGMTYQIKLFPLGFPDIDQKIAQIPEHERNTTILLLDAFDEDIKALDNYRPRLTELIKNTLDFREVVITCRTHFFPSEEEEPKETGVMRFGGEGGERVFYKLYLSPFDDKDIRTYLRKRFGWFRIWKKRKAHQIVKQSPNLMVRPMLLSYIDDLLQSDHQYTAPYLVYTELIARWIQREAHKIPSERRQRYEKELLTFSREIARDIYEHREERQGMLRIPGEAIHLFAEKHGIKLSEMEMKTRSLLNRDARGNYKFSHKSVLEYFLAEEAFFNADFRKELDFEGMDVAERFLEDMVLDRLTIPFFTEHEVSGEYRLHHGKLKLLTRLTPDLLANITFLKLDEWHATEDLLLFKGLKSLAHLQIGCLSSEHEQELRRMLPQCTVRVAGSLPLRRDPLNVSVKEAQEVFGLDDNWRPLQYIQNQYERQGDVVVDHATGLMWQQAGSDELGYKEVEQYVEALNRKQFAGYSDWRLPTIPELMSLLEPEKKHGDLYIDPVFDKKQAWCWSADRRTKGERSSESAWLVHFYRGLVYWSSLYRYTYVR